jgi:uncharacterized LabA/DUF88 family protein
MRIKFSPNVHISVATEDPVLVVTSDDDFVPAIRMALLAGRKVVQVHTGARRETPTHYVSPGTPEYIQTSL